MYDALCIYLFFREEKGTIGGVATRIAHAIKTIVFANPMDTFIKDKITGELTLNREGLIKCILPAQHKQANVMLDWIQSDIRPYYGVSDAAAGDERHITQAALSVASIPMTIDSGANGAGSVGGMGKQYAGEEGSARENALLRSALESKDAEIKAKDALLEGINELKRAHAAECAALKKTVEERLEASLQEAASEKNKAALQAAAAEKRKTEHAELQAAAAEKHKLECAALQTAADNLHNVERARILEEAAEKSRLMKEELDAQRAESATLKALLADAERQLGALNIGASAINAPESNPQILSLQGVDQTDDSGTGRSVVGVGAPVWKEAARLINSIGVVSAKCFKKVRHAAKTAATVTKKIEKVTISAAANIMEGIGGGQTLSESRRTEAAQTEKKRGHPDENEDHAAKTTATHSKWVEKVAINAAKGIGADKRFKF